jgi:ParB/RepB/Spo0J family partition protein
MSKKQKAQDTPEPSDKATDQKPTSWEKIGKSRGNYRLLPLDLVDVDPEQPRKIDENDPSIKELADSIKKHTLMNPVHVRFIEATGRFTIINGARRYYAFKSLKRKEIPAIVFTQEMDDKDKFIKQMVDNLQRVDLSPVDEAEGYQKLNEQGLTDEEIAEKVKKGRSTITDIRKITKLPESVKEKCRSSDIRISKDFLISLVKVEDVSKQEKLVEQHIKKVTAKVSAGEPKNPSTHFYAAWSDKIQGMKITISLPEKQELSQEKAAELLQQVVDELTSKSENGD